MLLLSDQEIQTLITFHCLSLSKADLQTALELLNPGTARLMDKTLVPCALLNRRYKS